MNEDAVVDSSFLARAYCALSRAVPLGAVRIETAHEDPDLTVAAWKSSPTEGSLILLIVNYGLSDLNIDLSNITDGQFSSVELTNAMTRTRKYTLTGGEFFTIEPGDIVVFRESEM
jgi:hypothetical protein